MFVPGVTTDWIIFRPVSSALRYSWRRPLLKSLQQHKNPSKSNGGLPIGAENHRKSIGSLGKWWWTTCQKHSKTTMCVPPEDQIGGLRFKQVRAQIRQVPGSSRTKMVEKQIKNSCWNYMNYCSMSHMSHDIVGALKKRVRRMTWTPSLAT